MRYQKVWREVEERKYWNEINWFYDDDELNKPELYDGQLDRISELGNGFLFKQFDDYRDKCLKSFKISMDIDLLTLSLK
jgi:hypothetical protein